MRDQEGALLLCFMQDEGCHAAGRSDSPMGLPGGAHVVDGEGALLAGLVTKPLQHLRNLFWVGSLQLPPPLPPHQVVHQRLHQFLNQSRT